MGNKILPLVLMLAAPLLAAPQKVVFDTDIGNDCDDVMALQMLLEYEKRGLGELLCIAVNKDNPFAPKFARLICEYYGHPGIPVFAINGGFAKADGAFVRATVEAKNPDGSPRFPLKNPDEKFEDSVRGLRRVLAAQPDNSVVYISVGFFTNIERLLKSQPDDISPLGGKELVARKVKYFSIMAGGFVPDDFSGRRGDKVAPEYNVKIDIPSAKYVFENTPANIVLSPFEVGLRLRFPYASVMHDFHNAPENPASFACHTYVYRIFKSTKNTAELDRYAWDLTSVLYAFEPQFFAISQFGDVKVDDKGVTHFAYNPSGKIRYLVLEYNPATGNPHRARDIVNRLVELCKGSPKK